MAMSFTADWGCEYGGGVTCHGRRRRGAVQQFKGWMAYNRIWFTRNQFAITPGGGVMTNPGRYLTLLPPINGADAILGLAVLPGDSRHAGAPVGCHAQLPVLSQGVHHVLGRMRGIATRMCRISRVAAASRLRAATTGRPQSFVVQHRRDCRHQRLGGRAGGVRRRADKRLVPRSAQGPDRALHGHHGEVLTIVSMESQVFSTSGEHGLRELARARFANYARPIRRPGC